MLRRTLLQSLAAVLVAPRAIQDRIQQPAAFGDPEIAALKAVADIVLPQTLGARGRDQVVADFVAWHRDYHAGADRGHSYGSSTIAQPSGPPPAARYPAQFSAIEADARAQGAASFAALSRDARRRIVEGLLNQPQPVSRMPARPTGANLVADLMGFYFNSGPAWDLCYNADIGRDRCRTLDGSNRAPAPLGSRR